VGATPGSAFPARADGWSQYPCQPDHARFLDERGAQVAVQGDEEFEYQELRGTGRTRWKGTVLANHGGRMLVRRNNGYLYSLPVDFRKTQTVFKHNSYRFYISHRVEKVPSLYVHDPRGNAKIWMSPYVKLAWNRGLTEYRVREILKLAREHEEKFNVVWQTCHPDLQIESLPR